MEYTTTDVDSNLAVQSIFHGLQLLGRKQYCEAIKVDFFCLVRIGNILLLGPPVLATDKGTDSTLVL